MNYWAHAFAQYVLVLHRPWSLQTHTPGLLNWDMYNRFVFQCKTGGGGVGGFGGRVRFQCISFLATQLSVSDMAKGVTMGHRSKDATAWKGGKPNPEYMFGLSLFNRQPPQNRMGEGDAE